MDNSSDVIYELFGNTEYVEVATVLETEMDYVLLHLRHVLGKLDGHNIRRAENRPIALANLLIDRKRDEVLVDAFRDYVLTSASLYSFLTHEARERANQRPRRVRVEQREISLVPVASHAHSF
jgi:hypothetical protein